MGGQTVTFPIAFATNNSCSIALTPYGANGAGTVFCINQGYITPASFTVNRNNAAGFYFTWIAIGY